MNNRSWDQVTVYVSQGTAEWRLGEVAPILWLRGVQAKHKKQKASAENDAVHRWLTQKLSGGGPLSKKCKQDAPPAVR